MTKPNPTSLAERSADLLRATAQERERIGKLLLERADLHEAPWGSVDAAPSLEQALMLELRTIGERLIEGANALRERA